MATHCIFAVTGEAELLDDLAMQMSSGISVEIARAEDSLDLVDRYGQCRGDVVILDLDILDTHIFQVLSILREMNSESHVLLLLSRERMDLCEQVLSHGNISYLVKPLSSQSAAGLIEPVLCSRAERRQASG